MDTLQTMNSVDLARAETQNSPIIAEMEEIQVPEPEEDALDPVSPDLIAAIQDTVTRIDLQLTADLEV